MVRHLLWKMWKADNERISRFHDGEGGLITPADLLQLPRRLLENLDAKRGKFAEDPWWPPKATIAIRSLIRPDWSVIEFGSGMSTLWLAPRVAQIVSVEHSRDWADRTRKSLDAAAVRNVSLLVRDEETYLHDLPDESFDLVIVDAIRRADCVRWALKHTKRGGYIYLDNADIDKDRRQEGVKNLARWVMRDAEKSGLGRISFYRGYPPAQLAPCEGALLHFLPYT